MRGFTAVLVSIVIVVFASACARETSAGRRATPDRNSPALSANASGEEIFSQVCSRCHGPDGTRIPDWKQEVRGMTDAQVRDQIRNGGGGMPAFRDRLTEEQINRVAEYAQQLARS